MWDSLKKSYNSVKNAIRFLRDKKNYENIKKLLKNYKILSDISNIIVSALVFLSGVLLIVSGIYPTIFYKIKFLDTIYSLSFLRFSHRASVLIGLMLIMTSREVFFKVKRAYYVTLTLLIIGGAFAFIKDLDYTEGIFILGVIILLILSKKSFYRESIPMKLTKLSTILIIFLFVIIIFASFIHKFNIHFSRNYRYYVDFFQNTRGYLRIALYTYIAFIIFVIIWYLTMPKIEKDERYMDADLDKISKFYSEIDYGTIFSHLVYLKDKKVFWANEGKSLIMYSKYKDKIIVLGDPIATRENLYSSIEEFQEFTDLYGYDVVFYEIEEKNFSTYHDAGYYFFKIGEEAVVNLEEFNLVGSKKSAFRNTLRRVEREGYSFQIIEPPFNKEVISQLKEISDKWLGSRKEKGFSLGWFSEDYIQRSPIAILKNEEENKIRGFVTIMDANDGGKTVAIDLMRIDKDAPNASMDYLMLNLFLAFKEKGYKYFSLGEAPLANVGFNAHSHLQEKIARLVYNGGNIFYSFDGLRRYKSKFSPVWQPRYLAYPKFMSLPEVFVNLCSLIANSKERVEKK
ncbi:phosphatidylglycerol lysyltransferase domain-containing protein [Clostridium sp. LIBA-8841]|uniref:phosphatidylglycerol lysyltransferase domain-containing protein n=1 Tax=Clostridium sp. LIBA-8841 TaxID=2987530 RepID=UPI002AC57A0F|nr:phosphatidylglycerol lysyltransferase domain-containing protein [Clostridium sp. LIBA-8841]MDZ5252515.1 phosphatidylglycerol lysyltransferase domain-containing protein [Clostridium sp. LIBA-8841]